MNFAYPNFLCKGGQHNENNKSHTIQNKNFYRKCEKEKQRKIYRKREREDKKKKKINRWRRAGKDRVRDCLGNREREKDLYEEKQIEKKEK